MSLDPGLLAMTQQISRPNFLQPVPQPIPVSPLQPQPFPVQPQQPQPVAQPAIMPQPGGGGGGNTNPFDINRLVNGIVQPIVGQPLLPNGSQPQPQPGQPGTGAAQPGQQPVLVDEVIEGNEEEGDTDEP